MDRHSTVFRRFSQHCIKKFGKEAARSWRVIELELKFSFKNKDKTSRIVKIVTCYLWRADFIDESVRLLLFLQRFLLSANSRLNILEFFHKFRIDPDL